MLLQEVLPTAHKKYGQFTLATGFGLLFGLVGAVRREEAIVFTQFLATLTGCLCYTLCVCMERDSQGALQAARREHYEKQAISRSHRKPLNAGEGRAIDHIFYRS